ncbi:MAG: tRNA (adenosine(37)-N6)-dimethylallyltransferase MiaA [Campylobacter sp.]|nr:tRNA (adenosine(37)-N6)-dimethylallyltransferase MiaA [Campylobacter sp.]
MFDEFAIIGTTASGKSSLAIEIAKQMDAVILSLDSLCLYKEINIASAKPSQDELRLIRHFGIDLVYPNEEFNAGNFIKEYQKAKNFANKNSIPLIITGGSGFYLSVLVSGLAPKIPKQQIYPSNDEIWQLVIENDEIWGEKFSQNDEFRLHKWYDIFKFCGFAPSDFLRQNTSAPTITNLPIFEICWDKEILRKRIEKRTCEMIEMGILNEASKLFSKYDKNLKPFKSIGLKECKEYMDGYIKNRGELCDLITTHTAQLAKKQRTFNRSKFPNRVCGSLDEIENLICKNLK